MAWDETHGIDVAGNLTVVKAEIARAAREAGRDPASVHLVAVSKTHGPALIRPAIAFGQRLFGENRVAEAEEKWPALKAEFPDLRLHLIGPLQRNKARRALALFDAIETLDRLELAETLARLADEGGRCPPLFVQVNTGEEPRKAGVAPAETQALVRHCRDRLGLPVVGLMCIPPVDEEPALHFYLLRNLAESAGLANLSMGMSHDYALAIPFGATHVRVGTAIFGARATGAAVIGNSSSNEGNA